MKKRKNSEKAEVHVFCNICGRELDHRGDILLEDYIQITKQWGYFSEHDLELHSFNICERCYNVMEKHFRIPVDVGKVKEVL